MNLVMGKSQDKFPQYSIGLRLFSRFWNVIIIKLNVLVYRLT
ncbi:TPA: hypothetical protein ACGXMZ_005415 [Bacillus albus]